MYKTNINAEIMITKDNIDNFIDRIPPKSDVLKETISLLNSGDLVKAAKVAQDDLALKSKIINSSLGDSFSPGI